MEAPKCKVCGDRHWGNCRIAGVNPDRVGATNAFKDGHLPRPKKIADEKPALGPPADPFIGTVKIAEKDKVPVERPCPERHGEEGEKPGIVVGYDFPAAAACPICAERKAKHAARVKKWRAKKEK